MTHLPMRYTFRSAAIACTLAMACGAESTLSSRDFDDPTPAPRADSGSGDTEAGPKLIEVDDPALPHLSAYVDMFVFNGTAVVVYQDRVEVVEGSGAVKADWTAPRELFAAAIDGASLILADAAMLLEVSIENLSVVRQQPLVERCSAVLLLSGNRVGCHEMNKSNWRLVTYERTGASAPTLSARETSRARRLWPRPNKANEFVVDGACEWRRIESDGSMTLLGRAYLSVLGPPAFTGASRASVRTMIDGFTLLDGCDAGPCIERGPGLVLPELSRMQAVDDTAVPDAIFSAIWRVVNFVGDLYEAIIQRRSLDGELLSERHYPVQVHEYVHTIRYDATLDRVWTVTGIADSPPYDDSRVGSPRIRPLEYQ